MQSLESGCQASQPSGVEKRSKEPLIDTDFVNYRYGLLRIAQAVVSVLWLVIIYVRTSSNNPHDNCWPLYSHSGQVIRIFVIIMVFYSLSSILLFCFRLQGPLDSCINVPLTLCVFESIGAVFFGVTSLIILLVDCYPLGLLLAMFGCAGSFAFGYDAKLSYFWFHSGICITKIW